MRTALRTRVGDRGGVVVDDEARVLAAEARRAKGGVLAEARVEQSDEGLVGRASDEALVVERGEDAGGLALEQREHGRVVHIFDALPRQPL